MKTVFDVYADPGHAWAAVPIRTLEDLGLSTEHFSGFSYRRGSTIYLEEDCDLSYFVKIFHQKTGGKPRWREHHSNKRSRIRGYGLNTPGGAYFQRTGGRT